MSASSWCALAMTFSDDRMVMNVRNSSPVTSAMAYKKNIIVLEQGTHTLQTVYIVYYTDLMRAMVSESINV